MKGRTWKRRGREGRKWEGHGRGGVERDRKGKDMEAKGKRGTEKEGRLLNLSLNSCYVGRICLIQNVREFISLISLDLFSFLPIFFHLNIMLMFHIVLFYGFVFF